MLASPVDTVIMYSISISYRGAPMNRKDFKSLLSQLDNLTYNQRKKLLGKIEENPQLESVEIVESQNKQNASCPHCSSSSVSRWGKSHGLQRYRCKECDKTFNCLTDTALSKLHYKEKWLTYSQCLSEGKTIREAAKICGIDPKTAFRWRHRFLSAPAGNKNEKMTGIVEADETFFTENCKGNRQIQHRKPKKRGKSSKRSGKDRVSVLIVRDRSGTEADFVYDQIKKETIHGDLGPLMGEEVVLCTDGNSIYQTFTNEAKIPHKRIVRLNKVNVVEEIFHIQNLNAYISRLKNWLRRFNGVATKYLENYLGWRRIIETKEIKISPQYYLKQALRKNDQQVMPT